MSPWSRWRRATGGFQRGGGGQVTKVLEDSLVGIDGADIITSISRQEQPDHGRLSRDEPRRCRCRRA